MIISRSCITRSEGRALLRLAECVYSFRKVWPEADRGIKGSGREVGGGAGLSPRLWLETFAMSWLWCLRTFGPPVCPLQGWNLKGREYKNFREGPRKHLLAQHRQSSLSSSFGSLNRYFPLFSLIPATMEFGAGMQGKWDEIRWDHWVLNSQGSMILGCYFRPALGEEQAGLTAAFEVCLPPVSPLSPVFHHGAVTL